STTLFRSALRWDRSRSGVLELPELGHQEEAVSEGKRELGGSEREGPGLHFVAAEPHRIRARHERLHCLTRRYRVDLGDVLEDPGHLLGQERQRLVAYVELREPPAAPSARLQPRPPPKPRGAATAPTARGARRGTACAPMRDTIFRARA